MHINLLNTKINELNVRLLEAPIKLDELDSVTVPNLLSTLAGEEDTSNLPHVQILKLQEEVKHLQDILTQSTYTLNKHQLTYKVE
jgi:hypothetical protein